MILKFVEAIKEEAIVSQGLFRIAGLVYYGLAGERRQTVAAQAEQHREGEYQQGLAVCTVHTSEGCTEILYRYWGMSAGVSSQNSAKKKCG